MDTLKRILHRTVSPTGYLQFFLKSLPGASSPGIAARHTSPLLKPQQAFVATTLVALLIAACYTNITSKTAHLSAPVPATTATSALSPVQEQQPASNLSAVIPSLRPSSATELIKTLKEHDLWNLQQVNRLSPLLLEGFPADLNEMETGKKKKAFLHSLLSVSLIALAEVEEERGRLQDILARIGKPEGNLEFAAKNTEWKANLAPNEITFIKFLTAKYRTTNGEQLLSRVDVLPISLILAQGAFESSWGTSRFAKEANNLFGMWTWTGHGIIPARRDEGKTHKIEIYDSILDSIRVYLLTINRHEAYEELRRIRRHSINSLDLADGLMLYSERGQDYIDDIKRIIQYNDLDRFDSLVLQQDRKVNLHPQYNIGKLIPNNIFSI